MSNHTLELPPKIPGRDSPLVKVGYMAMVDGTREAGATVTLVARRRGVLPNQLFTRRRLAEQGALAATQAEQEVVPASAFRAQQDMIRELQGLLGKKTLETDILMRRRGLARLAFFNPGSQAFFHRVMPDSQHDQDIHLDFTYQDVSRRPYSATGNPILGMPKVVM